MINQGISLAPPWLSILDRNLIEWHGSHNGLDQPMEGKYYFSQFTGVRCAHPIHLAYLSVSSDVVSARSGDLETPPTHQKRPTPAPETTLPSAHLLSKNIILLKLTWSTFLPEFTDNLYYKEKRRSIIHYKPQLFLWLWQLPEGAISYFFFFFLLQEHHIQNSSLYYI